MRGPFHDPKLSHNRAPTLETERLVLRHVRPADVDYFAAIHADEEVTRHIGGLIAREDAWRRAMGGAGFWSVLGIGLWAVDRRSDGETIGHVGFFDFQRDMQPSVAGEPEMGWVLRGDVQGHGYGGEACTAALAWFDATFNGVSVVALIGLENAPSIKLAERLGFERQADATYREERNALFRRPARG